MWNGEEFTLEVILKNRLEKEFNDVEIISYGNKFSSESGYKETVEFSFTNKRSDGSDSIIKLFENWQNDYLNNKHDAKYPNAKCVVKENKYENNSDTCIKKIKEENAKLIKENARLKQLVNRIDEECDNFLDKYDGIMQEYEDLLSEYQY